MTDLELYQKMCELADAAERAGKQLTAAIVPVTVKEGDPFHAALAHGTVHRVDGTCDGHAFMDGIRELLMGVTFSPGSPEECARKDLLRAMMEWHNDAHGPDNQMVYDRDEDEYIIP